MPAPITEFYSSFKKDLARPNKFDVTIPIPTAIQTYYGSMNRTLSLRCENAQLPGKTFMTHDQKIYGVMEKYPYMHSYNDISLTFIVSDDMSEKIFFDQWMDFISPSFANGSLNFQYKQNYTSLITINQYSNIGTKTYAATLKDAYPIAVNELDLDWSSTEHHKLVVVFAYTYFDVDKTYLPYPGSTPQTPIPGDISQTS